MGRRASPVFWLEVFPASGTDNLKVGHIGLPSQAALASLPRDTVYLERAVAAIRQNGQTVSDETRIGPDNGLHLTDRPGSDDVGHTGRNSHSN